MYVAGCRRVKVEDHSGAGKRTQRRVATDAVQSVFGRVGDVVDRNSYPLRWSSRSRTERFGRDDRPGPEASRWRPDHTQYRGVRMLDEGRAPWLAHSAPKCEEEVSRDPRLRVESSTICRRVSSECC